MGAVRAPGQRTVTSWLRGMGLRGERPCTNSHRGLNRAPWSTLQTGKILLGVIVTWLVPPGAVIVLGADETLERRSGRKLPATGCDREAVRSSKKHVGHC